MEQYNGYRVLELTDSELNALYNKTYNSENFKENEYLIVKEKEEVVDYFCKTDGVMRRIDKYPCITNDYTGTIKPLDPAQYCAIDLLQNKNVPVKVIRGVYGSGKDFLMFNQALMLIEKGIFNKIIFVRPNVTLANVPQIGYLPNGIEEKLGWTMAPLYDKIGGEEGIQRLVQEGRFEMVPLLFIRGRSFENSIVYVTEAQNMDSSIAKVLLSRIGQGSELWLNGDDHKQTDSILFDKDNGFKLMVDRLQGNPLFGYVYLATSHRSAVANLSNLLD